MPTKKPDSKPLSKLVAPILFKSALRVIGLTCRKKWIGLENLERLRDSGQNYLYSIWHDNITLAALLLKRQNLLSLVSSSEDGSFATDVLDSWGYQTVRGSSSRGGIKAILTMIKELKSGKSGAMNPDGPRGPRYQLQKGILVIGQKARVPIIPFHVECTRQWVLSSWDKHKFPKPFSTLFICIGEPYLIPEDLNRDRLDETRKQFEEMMLINVQKTLKLVEEAKKIIEI